MGQQTTGRMGRSLPEALAALAGEGVACQVVMLDGRLVHPAAPVPEAWSEARLKTPAGMVTVRRRGEAIEVVVFGNAGADVVAMRDRVTAALAG